MTGLKENLSKRIYDLIDNVHKYGSKKIIRLEISYPNIDCLAWLNRQTGSNKIYWSDRNGNFEMAGFGTADSLSGNNFTDYEKVFSEINLNLSGKIKNLRYYGGMSFFNKKHTSEWKLFGSYCFVIPRFEILRIKGKTYFAFNIAKNDINLATINKCIKELRNLHFPAGKLKCFIPKIHSVKNFPEKEQWEDIFKKIIKPSGETVFKKIVLAKKTAVAFNDKLNCMVLFSLLKKQTKDCFHYYFQPSKNTVFLGASPERLLKADGFNVESEAIAGTKPRGSNKYEDKILRQKLLSSDKEALEHKFVVDMIRETLSKFCSSLHSDNKFSIIKVSTGQHLITRFKGVLKKGVKNFDVLSSLHPTPAVAGHPTDKALDAILKLEPFDRGWYAGPIGFIGYAHFDFAVALRCAMIHGANANLYAGAGIVEGSTAGEEWHEIENKNSVFMRIFNKYNK